ncbi:Lnt Apolipoprotein N-acyltransferase [Burkholderiaceae bacterium]
MRRRPNAHRGSFPRVWLILGLIIAGLLQALSLAWPLSGDSQGVALGWLQILSLSLAAACVDRCDEPKDAFWSIWWFASAWLVGCLWWLFISMNTYGGMPALLAGAAVWALSASLACFYGAAAWVYRSIQVRQLGVLSKASTFAVVWMLAEMGRGTFFTGLPWGAIGYAHVDGILQTWASWFGVYGLSAMAAFVAMLLGAQGQRTKYAWRSRLTGGLLACVVTVVGVTSLNPIPLATQAEVSPPLRVTLLQGNVPQDLKFGSGVSKALTDYRQALLTSRADLVVTPETALPLLPRQLPDGYWQDLQQHFTQRQQAALVGMPLDAPMLQEDALNARSPRRYTNSVLALQPHVTGELYRYDKHHLVPFGEFVPPMFQWFVRLMNMPMGDFSRGAVVQPLFAWKGERIAPNICYEDLFGEELAKSFANPEQAPTILVNLSNIAWFGDTVAIDQHLNISRMRAMELGRPMLRATNTGATAIINAQGVVTQRLPSGVQGALNGEVQGIHGPVTFYSRWVSAWGLWPLVALAFTVLAFVSWLGSRARQGKRYFGP